MHAGLLYIRERTTAHRSMKTFPPCSSTTTPLCIHNDPTRFCYNSAARTSSRCTPGRVQRLHALRKQSPPRSFTKTPPWPSTTASPRSFTMPSPRPSPQAYSDPPLLVYTGLSLHSNNNPVRSSYSAVTRTSSRTPGRVQRLLALSQHPLLGRQQRALPTSQQRPRLILLQCSRAHVTMLYARARTTPPRASTTIPSLLIHNDASVPLYNAPSRYIHNTAARVGPLYVTGAYNASTFLTTHTRVL